LGNNCRADTHFSFKHSKYNSLKNNKLCDFALRGKIFPVATPFKKRYFYIFLIIKASRLFQISAQKLNTGVIMQIAQCFKVLNVCPGEDWRKVRQSYHSLAKQFHPDLNPQPASLNAQSGETRLKEINQAFEKLETHYKTSQNIQQPQNKWATLFKRLGEKPAVQRAVNTSVNFLIDLDRKVFQLDIQKDIKISESAQQNGASLNLKSGKDQFEIKVPSGDWNEMSLRVPGRGENSLFSKRRGDLVLNLRVPVQKISTFGNSRFSYEMKFPRQNIERGKVLTLNSSEGPIKFILPRNTRDGQSFTLRSQRVGGQSETLHILTVRLD
jgi:hypothetical protein